METKKIISVEITSCLKEALRIEAFNQEVTVSALIRQILETQLKDTIEQCRKNDIKRG